MNDVQSVKLDIGKPDGFVGVPDVLIADVYADDCAGPCFLRKHLGCNPDTTTDIDDHIVLANMTCKEIRGGLNAQVSVETVVDHPLGHELIVEFADVLFV